MRQLSRDPFARTTLFKEIVETSDSCSWCGSQRKDGKLFRYYTETDGIRTRSVQNHGSFCCKSCHDSYHTYT
jgi:hypothetical protein